MLLFLSDIFYMKVHCTRTKRFISVITLTLSYCLLYLFAHIETSVIFVSISFFVCLYTCM